VLYRCGGGDAYTTAMCGRYTLHADTEKIIRRFLLDRPDIPLFPRYNIAPTQLVAVVRGESGKRELVSMKWGLVPSWADDPSIGNRMINARAETLGEKPAFRGAFKHRRCLVLADGFYEWRRDKGGKTPMFIRRKDGDPFAFAGLWERWTSKETGEQLQTCTIITTAANELIAPIHVRMPVILRAEDEDRWLAGDDPATLLKPYPAEGMEASAVSRKVNTPAVDEPGCIVRVQ
jgi:putative SOS response-associated peptidase YedK